MPETITWSQSVRLPSGLQRSTSQLIEVEAYDVVETTVGADAADLEIQVQPGPAAQVRFLMIEPSGDLDDLTYKVNNAGNPEIGLTGPQTFVGPEAVALLGADPGSLFFSSGPANDAVVRIVVGRVATA
jgi:hypothetical protein